MAMFVTVERGWTRWGPVPKPTIKDCRQRLAMNVPWKLSDFVAQLLVSCGSFIRRECTPTVDLNAAMKTAKSQPSYLFDEFLIFNLILRKGKRGEQKRSFDLF